MDASTSAVITSISAAITTITVTWIGFKMKKLEHNMNSMREELVKTTAKSSHAEGVLAGKAEQKATDSAAR